MKKIFTSLFALIIASALYSQTYVSEDFSTFTDSITPPIPSAWKNQDSSATPLTPPQIWRFDNPSGKTLNSPIAGIAAILDSDWYGAGNSQDAHLLSPTFDASLATIVILEFDHFYQHIGGSPGSTGEVHVFDGAIWHVDTLFTATTADPSHEVIDISSYVAGVSNAQVRFRYTGNYAWHWIIDNVTIFQPTPDDASVVSVDSTVVAGCGLDSAETIAATIVNAGSTTIRNFPISFSINGATPVTETVSDSITPGDSLLFIFTATANFATSGTYNIDVFTSLRGDANPANDSAFAVTVHKNSITTYPYTEGFESGNGGWIPGGVNGTWAIGAPTGNNINSAATGLNSYVTNLTGNYNNNDESYVLGPCFDFSTLNAPQIKMNVWWNSEFSWDGAVLQMSIDNGLTWQKVGAFGDPNNWYTDNSINGLQNIEPSQEGWSGRNSTSNGSGGWVLAEHDLTGAANQPSVQIRVVFGSDGSITDDGFAFDDILIQDAPATDAAVVNIIRPSNGCGLGSADSLEISIANVGSAVISNFPVGFILNAAAPVTETYTASINPGDTVTYTFTATLNLATQTNHSLQIFTAVPGDGNALNDSLIEAITNIPVVSTFPYNQGFESGNGGWISGGVNNSWAIAPPTGTVINFAANGVNAYVTNPSGSYNNGEESFIQGPCFDFSNLAAPQFKMNVWWNSEFSWDGAVLQSSIDGGASWQKVGAFGDPNNWYTDNSINGLVGLEPSQEGWSGRNSSSNGSGGWLLAEHDLTGLGGQAAVLMRIAFGSDGSVTDEGIAIDDIFIQDAPSADAGIVSLVAPGTNCGFGTMDSVTISLANFGSDTIMNIPVAVSFNGNPAVIDTVRTILLAGDTITHTFSNTTVNLSAPGSYGFGIRTILPMDGNALNDSIYVIVDNTLRNIPYSENFDTFIPGTGFNNAGGMLGNGWEAIPDGSSGTDFFWGVRNTATGSGGTGPDMDHTTGTTNFIYVEGSLGGNGSIAELISPCIELSGTIAPRMEFWYHKFGTNMGTLYVDVFNGTVWTTVDSIVGSTQTATTDPYLVRSVALSSFAGLNIQVRFRTSGKTGFSTDMAIDDFRVFEPQANDVGVIAINSPTTGAYTSTTDSVRALVVNFGTSNASTIPVNYSLNGGAVQTDTITALNVGDTIEHVFSVPVALPSPGNTSTLDVYTTYAPDSVFSNDSSSVVFENLLKTVPFFEDFETFGFQLNGINFRAWNNTNGGITPDWSSGMNTPSIGTGPIADHTIGAGGTFVYLETSGGFNGSDTLESPTIIIPSTMPNVDLTYWYHMFGAAMGDLEVWVDTNGTSLVFLDSISGQQQIAQTDPWQADTITMVGYAGKVVKILFVGKNGTTFTSDMAIDDVALDSSTAIITGIVTTISETSSFSVYPNPSKGLFTLSISTKQTENFKLSVSDVKGQVVHQEFLNVSGTLNEQLDFTSLSKGVYFLQLQNNNSTSTKKLIIR